jgi:hypothetical protein
MQNLKIKNGIIIALLGCIILLTTCEFSKPNTGEDIPFQDTLFLNQWRREKQAKLDLIVSYENKVSQLQHDVDSLKQVASEGKKSISAYRFKAKHFQQQLKQSIELVIVKDSLTQDSILPIFDSLMVSQDQSNSACDTTINALESIVAKRDSSLEFQKQISVNLRDINKEQELRNLQLTSQLNLSFKNQRKKSRQNKILAGGLLILSGITTSLLITQSLK